MPVGLLVKCTSGGFCETVLVVKSWRLWHSEEFGPLMDSSHRKLWKEWGRAYSEEKGPWDSNLALASSLSLPVMVKLTCNTFLTPWHSKGQNQPDKIPWICGSKSTSSPCGSLSVVTKMRKIIYLPNEESVERLDFMVERWFCAFDQLSAAFSGVQMPGCQL